MDPWITGEIWWRSTRGVGKESLNAGRFALCCFFGAIVAGELLYLLRNMARHGKQSAIYNFLPSTLASLTVQFIALAIAMWFAYAPWRNNYPVCIAPTSVPVIFAHVATSLPSVS